MHFPGLSGTEFPENKKFVTLYLNIFKKPQNNNFIPNQVGTWEEIFMLGAMARA